MNKVKTLLAVAELIICICLSCFLCFFVAYCLYGVKGYLYYPCGIQSYIAIGCFFLYPLFLLLSLWKKVLPYTRYAFALMGTACIASGVIILTACLLNSEVVITWGGGRPDSAVTWGHMVSFFFLPVYGMGCLLRYLCCTKYSCVLYTLSLFPAAKDSPPSTRSFVRLLLIYFALYAVLIGCCC